MNNGIDILLIEDDEDNAEAIIRILKQNLSINILHFEDGAEALKFLLSEESNSVKLVLLDLILPGLDGIEILKRMKDHPQKKDIPIIVLIASLQGKVYVDSYGLQPDGFANKPGRYRECA